MSYNYYTCDVFTDTAFGGNPLAVIPDATGLSTEQMQSIAREFNYSESTFVLPSKAGHTAQVRIFTPTREVPFAGHPNVGTAYVLTQADLLPADDDRYSGEQFTLEFEEQAGVVPVTVQRSDHSITCELCAPEKVSIGIGIPVELVAGALGLSVTDIVCSEHHPQVVSVGLPFILAEVSGLDALERIDVDTGYLKKIEALGVMPDLHVYCRADDEFDLRTRMFAPFDGIVEDPATGSANCALAGLLAQLDDKVSGNYQWRIAQGVEMGRPSTLNARVEKRDGVVTDTWIAGECVMVMSGLLEIPVVAG